MYKARVVHLSRIPDGRVKVPTRRGPLLSLAVENVPYSYMTLNSWRSINCHAEREALGEPKTRCQGRNTVPDLKSMRAIYTLWSHISACTSQMETLKLLKEVLSAKLKLAKLSKKIGCYDASELGFHEKDERLKSDCCRVTSLSLSARCT